MDFNEIFPDNRESGETTIRQCQLVMLRMLRILDFLCKKHSINYFLVGGTLLGAIRHKGFIPWDDDLDIGMTRENYDKFINLAVPELPTDIFFQNPKTDPFYSPKDYVNAKLRDKYSSYANIKGQKNKHHEGLQVDIFVYDKVYFPNKFLIICQNIFFNNIILFIDKNNRIKKFIENYITLNLVYCNNWMQSFGMLKFGVNFLKECEVQELINVKFEDMITFIPVGWKSQLGRQYGEYMKLPSEDKRISNHSVIGNPVIHCGHKESLTWNSKIKHP